MRAALAVATMVASTASSLQLRHFFIACKSVVENRIRYDPVNSGRKCVEMYYEKLEKDKHPEPQNRKEELEHLTRMPRDHYISDFQRAANDLMCVTDNPDQQERDLIYHFSTRAKICRPSGRARWNTPCPGIPIKIKPM